MTLALIITLGGGIGILVAMFMPERHKVLGCCCATVGICAGAIGLIDVHDAMTLVDMRQAARDDARASQHEQVLLAATTSAERTLARRYGRFSACMTDLAVIAPALDASRTGDYTIAAKLAPAIHRLLLTANHTGYNNTVDLSRSTVIDVGATPVSSC